MLCGLKRKPYGWQVCEDGLLEFWPQLYHQIPQVEGDAAGATMRGVCPHAPVNHTVFFLCHGFNKFMYINKILMKTRLQFLYITGYKMNYFVSQPVGLEFTSGSGFCHWVWILPVGLDFASGSGYENPMGQTPCCIMWSTHNHGIKLYINTLYIKEHPRFHIVISCTTRWHMVFSCPDMCAYGSVICIISLIWYKSSIDIIYYTKTVIWSQSCHSKKNGYPSVFFILKMTPFFTVCQGISYP